MAPAADSTRPSSRDRVLAVLRDTPQPVGVGAVCESTGLSPNAVRFHLDRLIARGVVRAVKDPKAGGSGRPALVYSAAPAEAFDAAAAYRTLAGLLASELVRSAGPQAADEAGRAWARSLLKTRDVGGADPMALVVSLLEDGGFRPAVSTDGSAIELSRCPFLDLALVQPGVVCGVHLGMISGVLELVGATTEVQLLPVMDDGPCLVTFGAAGPSASHSRAVASPTEENAS